MALIIVSFAWVAGVFLGSRLEVHPAFLALGLAPLPLFFFLRQRRKLLILTSLCIIAVFAGAIRFQATVPAIDESSLRFYNDRAVELRGMVEADPEVRDRSTHIRFAAEEIKLAGGWERVSGSALLFVSRSARYEYGDVLLVKGKLETPPRLGDFDYRDYLAHQEIFSTMTYPRAEILEREKGNRILGWIYSLRNRMSSTLAAALPEPQASLAQGMVLGVRGNIPSSLNADLSRTGTMHILAISGLHVSIVAGILVSIGIWFFGRRRYVYVWLALGAIWFYALITGMEPPVVRSTIMASLFLIAELLGRQRSAMTSLAFAAAVMIGISPQILWTASFQMSFLAMAGIVLIAPAIKDAGRRAVGTLVGESGLFPSAAFTISDGIAVTLGAIAAVYPVIAYYFGIISFVSPLATLLALPSLAGIIVTGALTGALGLIAAGAAYIASWLAWLFLSYMLLIVEVFASVPSFVGVSPGSAMAVGVYYLVLTGACMFMARRRRLSLMGAPEQVARQPAPLLRGRERNAVLALLVVAVLAWSAAAAMPDDNLHVSFLDVGEGDAILIQTPAHQDILVDGGGSAQALNLGLGKKMPFWDRTIDLVILTHPHSDHLRGLLEVADRYRVKQVLLPGADSDSALYRDWLGLLEEKGISSLVARAGQWIEVGRGVQLAVLSPESVPTDGTESDIDNSSTVLRLSLGDVSFVFAGDIGRETEWGLLNRRAELRCTVLKVAHHGSESATSAEFLAVAKPQFAVISVGVDNKYGHPAAKTLSGLETALGESKVYRTDEQGTIEFTTDGERLWVKLEKLVEH